MNAPQKRADALQPGDQVECDDGWAVVHHVFLPSGGPNCLIHFEGGTSTMEQRDWLLPTRPPDPPRDP